MTDLLLLSSSIGAPPILTLRRLDTVYWALFVSLGTFGCDGHHIQAVGAPPIRFLVTGITARILDQALDACTPNDGGVHAGSPSDPALFASG